jgi:ferritin-like protein
MVPCAAVLAGQGKKAYRNRGRSREEQTKRRAALKRACTRRYIFMAGASQGYHEAEGKLSPDTKDIHRAVVSLQEELEAIDWYRQRADATENEALKAVLLHNMEEEIEHACMVLEWLRRYVPVFEKHLRTYLFQDRPITAIEEKEEGSNGDVQPSVKQPARAGLTVGMMKGM